MSPLDPVTEPVAGPVADLPASWPVVASTDLHRDGWVVALRSDQVTLPDHDESFRRLVVEHPGAAAVLALDDEDRVLLVRQYRHPVQRSLVEFPAGLCDVAGEDPLEVAKRELREEVAHEASEWTHLLSTYSSPGISAEVMHLYLARGLRACDRGDFVLEHEEADMEMLWMPYDDLLAAVLDGRIASGPVAQAVLAVKVRGLV